MSVILSAAKNLLLLELSGNVGPSLLWLLRMTVGKIFQSFPKTLQFAAMPHRWNQRNLPSGLNTNGVKPMV